MTILLDHPASEYHALKALSASGVMDLVDECPFRFWLNSPFNPAFVADHNKAFDIGTAAHLAVLEPQQFGARTVIIDAPDYKTTIAKTLRDSAYAAGQTPLLRKQTAIVEGVSKAIFEQAGSYFTGGDAEATLTWDWGGVPCKARPDYLSADRLTIVDLKTTTTVNPRAITKKAFNEGWHVRVPWYKEAVMTCCPVLSSPRGIPRYIFVCIEVDPPHLIQTFEMDERAEAWGQQIIRRGLHVFKECAAANNWPGYAEGVVKLGLPAWSEYQLADREAAGEFSGRFLDA